MPRLDPFPGLRYDTGRVALDRVIAPPYDVIAPAERARLAKQHRTAAVRLELPEPDGRAGLDRYQAAAALLGEWQQGGALRLDGAPSLYPYRMTAPSGRATTGIIGALALDGADDGTILPHEQTLPKPKSDRLDLLRATRCNLSPIWGLSLADGLTETFFADGGARLGPPVESAADADGVVHELWVLDDAGRIAAVGDCVASAAVVIADGHHRYETALAYRSERRAEEAPPLPSGAAAVMAFVVELSDEQLEVGAVHRALSGLPDGLDLIDVFSSWFDATRVGDCDAHTMHALGQSHALALIMPSGAWLLSPRDGTPEAAGADLDSSMVALVLAELPDHQVDFCHTWEEVNTAIETEAAQAVVALRPVSVERIASWARAGRRMPPKSTYFHPKPRTGMVFRTLD